jgi:excisionase family DNA binding protein
MSRKTAEATKLPFDREGFAEVSEVAEYLSLSTTSIYNLIAAGDLPHARFGQAIRIPRRAVVEYSNRKLAEQEQR